MKKFISMCTACFILCSLLIVQSSAIDITTEQKAILKDAEQYAYLDPDTASPELQEKILDARNAIIFSQGWVADGHTGYIQDVRTGEILRELPTFSELFPDWDMPTADTVPKSDSEYTEPSVRPFQAEITPLADTSSWKRVDEYYTYINAATSSTAKPFTSLTVNPYSMGTTVRIYATELTSSQTCNLGISNADTGAYYATDTNLSPYEAIAVGNLYYTKIALRTSTYSTPGWGTIALDGADRVADLR